MVVHIPRPPNFAIVYESCFVSMGLLSRAVVELGIDVRNCAIINSNSTSSKIGRSAIVIGRMAEIGQ